MANVRCITATRHLISLNMAVLSTEPLVNGEMTVQPNVLTNSLNVMRQRGVKFRLNLSGL